jgi:hypothetical protein
MGSGYAPTGPGAQGEHDEPVLGLGLTLYELSSHCLIRIFFSFGALVGIGEWTKDKATKGYLHYDGSNFPRRHNGLQLFLRVWLSTNGLDKGVIRLYICLFV